MATPVDTTKQHLTVLKYLSRFEMDWKPQWDNRPAATQVSGPYTNQSIQYRRIYNV
jgi:hypothetical protein